MTKRTTKQIGDKGEDLAVTYLIEQSYIVICRNYRYRRAEIDVIAQRGDVVVFVEVKSKSYTAYGEPEESITSYKEKLIFDAANSWIFQNSYDGQIRFDIISIVFKEKGEHQIKHFEDAFFFGL